MNTRKLRWLNMGHSIINLDNVNAFHQANDEVTVSFNGGGSAVYTGITIDEIHHYLKYGKPKLRR